MNDGFEITIRLGTAEVEKAVRDEWQRAFTPPEYRGDATRPGWHEVQKQVAAHIQSLDLSKIIARIAAEKVCGVVDEIVTAHLREAAKKKAKEMNAMGTLFERKDETKGE